MDWVISFFSYIFMDFWVMKEAMICEEIFFLRGEVC